MESLREEGEVSTNFIFYIQQRFGITWPSYLSLNGKTRVRGITIEAKEKMSLLFSLTSLNKDSQKQNIYNIGITVGKLYKKEKKFKPSSSFLQLFGKQATRNLVFLFSRELLRLFLSGKTIDLKKEEKEGRAKAFVLSPGYVVVLYKDKNNTFSLGCGLYSSNHSLISQTPKWRRIA